MNLNSKLQDIAKLFSPKGIVLLFVFVCGSLFSSVLYRSLFHIPERKQLQYEAALIQQKNNHLRARLNCVERQIQCDFKVNKDFLK
jgi:hypothetical protein